MKGTHLAAIHLYRRAGVLLCARTRVRVYLSEPEEKVCVLLDVHAFASALGCCCVCVPMHTGNACGCTLLHVYAHEVARA